MTPRRRHLAAVLAAVLMVVPGCGGGDDDDEGASATTSTLPAKSSDDEPSPEVTISAGDLFFKPKEVTVPAGTVTFTLVNEGVSPHTLKIDGAPGLNLTVDGKGDTDKGRINLLAGEYKLYCDVPGHQAAGMEAKLTVK